MILKNNKCTIYAIFIIVFFSIALISQIQGQTIEVEGASLQTPLEIPYQFSKGENICRNEIPASRRVTGSVWEIFPLKNDVALYSAPNGAQQINTASTGDHFVVFAERKGYLLLAAGPTWGEQIIDMNFKGWGKKSDFILHRMAIRKKGIWRKAMVVNFIPSEQQTQLVDQDFQIASIYNNPECQGEPIEKIRVFRFLFVFETNPRCSDQPKSVLVGNKPVLSSKEDLLGWIPIHRITLWDTREALEINFDQNAQASRESLALPASVFENLQTAYLYAASKGQHNNEVIRKNRISTENFSIKYWPPGIIRYPILRRIDMRNLKNDEKDDIYEIGFIGNTIKLGNNDEAFKGEISRERAAQQQQALELTIKDFSKLDILFVVDATSSMGPYLKATANAIENALQSISEQYSDDWDIRFSGAIFRDYEDEKNNNLFNHQDLTANREAVTKFFRNAKDKSADMDYPEAVFYGLRNAIIATHFRPRSMRYVVLISDAGNHEPDKRGLSSDRVAKSLYDYQCHFLCIRVAPNSNSGREAGPLLKAQVREWMINNSQRAQNEIQQQNVNTRDQFSGYLSSPQLRDMGDLMFMVGSHVLGAYVVADNSDETQSFIENYLAKAVDIHDLFRDVTRLLATGASISEAFNVLQSSETSTENDPNSPNTATQALIKENGIGAMQYDQVWLHHILSRIPNADDLLQRRVTIYKRAFVNMYNEDLKDPLFKPVVLMTASSLISLINLIEDLVASADTERLSESWRKILDALSGEEGILKSVSEYAQQQLSLPVNSELLKLTLQEIDELSIVKTRQMVADINKKKNMLEQILYDDSSNKKRWFLMSELKYYWIRVEELP